MKKVNERLRNEVLNKIKTLEDSDIIEAVRRLLEIASDNEPVPVNEEDWAAIEDGIRDIEAGRYLSHEEAEKRAQEWLKD